jgi:hypothetical protein
MLKFGSAKGFGGLAPIATERAAPVPAYRPFPADFGANLEQSRAQNPAEWLGGCLHGEKSKHWCRTAMPHASLAPGLADLASRTRVSGAALEAAKQCI